MLRACRPSYYTIKEYVQLPRVGSGYYLEVRDTVLCIWGPEGVYHGRGCRLLVAMEYYNVHIYDDVSRSEGPKEAQCTDGLYDADKGAMKVEGQARLETFACAMLVAGCTWAEGMICQKTAGEDTMTGPALASQHACCFVSWLLQCTHKKRPCFLLVAMLLRCYALPHWPRRSNGLALVAVAYANALQLPLPPKPGWPVSLVLWVLHHAVGHPRQPWDPRDRARQEPPVGARYPVTPVDGMIRGWDYDYDYMSCMHTRASCLGALARVLLKPQANTQTRGKTRTSPVAHLVSVPPPRGVFKICRQMVIKSLCTMTGIIYWHKSNCMARDVQAFPSANDCINHSLVSYSLVPWNKSCCYIADTPPLLQNYVHRVGIGAICCLMKHYTKNSPTLNVFTQLGQHRLSLLLDYRWSDVYFPLVRPT